MDDSINGIPHHILRRAALLFAIAVALYAALAFFADAPGLVAAISAFRWVALPIATALTLANYGIRFAKWQYFLRVVEVRVPIRQSLPVFLAGLGMAITPGKVGELVKSHLLREAHGVPISVSAPIVVADRITDLLAMLMLALGGLVSREQGPVIAIAVLIVCIAASQVLRWRTGALQVLELASRVPLIARRRAALLVIYESSFRLFGPRSLTTTTLLSIAAWFAECAALYVILVGLGQQANSMVLLEATYSYALATLIGAISLLPGGLGAQEFSLASLLWLAGVGISREVAATATILVRLVTFWLGVVIGLAALGYCLRIPSGGHGPAIHPLDGARVDGPSSDGLRALN